MKVYQVISVSKHDLDFQIQLIAAFKSFENARNYIRLAVKCWEEIAGPCHRNLGDFGEYIASCRLKGTPFGFEDYYIKTCPVIDEIGSHRVKEEEYGL